MSLTAVSPDYAAGFLKELYFIILIIMNCLIIKINYY